MMAQALYNTGIRLYRVIAGVAAWSGNAKAQRWIAGRRNWQQRMKAAGVGQSPLIWFHAASLGEFEQGRPVIEAVRREYPAYKILLTFFSPSGYEVRKDYPGADFVYYLPLDTAANARDLMAIARPRLAVFIKYEFWYHYISALHRQQVPLLLISGIFRPNQIFFKGYGGMFRRLLQQFTHLFVQNEASLDCLRTIGITSASRAGDTRFDRVWALRQSPADLPLIAAFCGGKPAMVAGSTWEDDERLLAAWWQQVNHPSLQLIIAPHEIHESHIQAVMALFPGAVRYTQLAAGQPAGDARVLIIDNIGLLSGMYRYGSLTYVGGGFGKDGVHNVLEPATYGRPVIIGPVYDKFIEAVELVEAGGALVVKDAAELTAVTSGLLTDTARYEQVSRIAGDYVAGNQGATGKILAYIQEKRFLSSV